jgi:hypothetical protein
LLFTQDHLVHLSSCFGTSEPEAVATVISLLVANCWIFLSPSVAKDSDGFSELVRS